MNSIRLISNDGWRPRTLHVACWATTNSVLSVYFFFMHQLGVGISACCLVRVSPKWFLWQEDSAAVDRPKLCKASDVELNKPNIAGSRSTKGSREFTYLGRFTLCQEYTIGVIHFKSNVWVSYQETDRDRRWTGGGWGCWTKWQWKWIEGQII